MITFFKKINYLLNSRQKNKIFILFLLVLIGVFFETLGIGLIIPLFKIITDPNILDKFPILEYLINLSPFNWFSEKSDEISTQILLITGSIIGIIIVYSLKTCFLAFLSWVQNRLVTNLGIQWSEKLYSGYLHLPYASYIKKNSAILLRNVNQAFVVASSVELSLTLITEVLVTIGIAILLIVTEPKGALTIIFIFAILGYFFHSYTKKYLEKWGEKRHFYDGQRIKHMNHGFGGAKDLKILGREKNFLNHFLISNNAGAIASRNQRILRSFPRLWLEIMVVICMSVLLFFMIIDDQSIDQIIPTLGLFAAASFRLMPSVNKILGNFQGLNYQMPVVNNIYNELVDIKTKNQDKTNNSKIEFKKDIKLDQINYLYDGTTRSVINDINLIISRGSQVGFVGESGSGKTTLIDIILGLLKPTKGTVKVDNNDIQKNLRSWQNQIGYVPQEIFLIDDTLRKNIAFGISDHDISEKLVNDAIKASNLDSFVKNLPEGLDTNVGERGVRLSGGQRQRIGIARALYHQPDVLVLDEATSALDLDTEKEIMESIFKMKKDKTVLIISHRLTTVSNCNQVFKISDGKIFQNGKIKNV